MKDTRFHRTIVRYFATSCICFFLLSQTGMAQLFQGSNPNAPTQNAPRVQTRAYNSAPPTNPNITGLPSAPANEFTDARTRITLEPLPSKRGLLVKEVQKFKLGARNGLEPGDVIIEFNGRAVSSPTDMTDAVNSIPNSASLIYFKIVDIRTGLVKSLPFSLSTNAGLYTTNFGKLELNEIPKDGSPQETGWNGTLHHGSNAYAIEGSFNGSSFTGTLVLGFGEETKVSLDLVPGNGKKMFQGRIGDARNPSPFMIIEN